MVVLLPGSQRSSGGKRKRQAMLMSRSKRLAMKDGTKGNLCKCSYILEVPKPIKELGIYEHRRVILILSTAQFPLNSRLF